MTSQRDLKPRRGRSSAGLCLLGLICVLFFEKSSLDPKTPLLSWSSDLTTSAEIESPETPPAKPSLNLISTAEVLEDTENRVSDTFAIPKGLEARVGFWIEVYSKYTSEDKIIHHLDYPWIQFEVFNISEILAQPSRFKWINPEKAEKEALLHKKAVERRLGSLYRKLKRKQIDQLDDEESKYYQVLQKLPGSIERNVRQARSRVRIQTGQKDHFQSGLGIANRYLPHMEEIFVKRGLPPEISRLPLVESSFEKRATSKVGAVGLWQFMNSTGQKFLVMNSFIDERESPIKSTEAAADLLKENYMIMGKSWPLAITAWNHGPGGLKKAIRELKTRDIVKIISYFESKQFSFASENFYAEFLAALHVEKYSNRLFEDIQQQDLLEYETHQLTQRVRPQQLFKKVGISEEEFVDFNPDLRRAVKRDLPLPKGLIILIHPDKTQDLVKLSPPKVGRILDI
jgi:membrane-bound lytic murein transglycosylase D